MFGLVGALYDWDWWGCDGFLCVVSVSCGVSGLLLVLCSVCAFRSL